MLIIPAIDLRRGKCVRLQQGLPDQETVFGEDPLAVAREWASQGASRLHLVDLDAAFDGEFGQNLEVISDIISQVKVEVQVGGGVRNLSSVERLLDLGASRVILGTAAVENPFLIREACRRYPGRIMAGIDVRQGKVATRGWMETVPLSALELTRRMAEVGVEEIVYTDAGRDGMLQGPDLEGTLALARETGVRVILSGGVGSMADLEAVAVAVHRGAGLGGVIVGKALYTGRINLGEAVRLYQKTA